MQFLYSNPLAVHSICLVQAHRPLPLHMDEVVLVLFVGEADVVIVDVEPLHMDEVVVVVDVGEGEVSLPLYLVPRLLLCKVLECSLLGLHSCIFELYLDSGTLV